MSEQRSRPTTVVIADDHPIVRQGMRSLLQSMPGFTVVGEAADGVEALEMALVAIARLVYVPRRTANL